MSAETLIRDQTDAVTAWRAEQLEAAGYDARDAAKLAERRDVDLHAAVALIERGCSPALATKILL